MTLLDGLNAGPSRPGRPIAARGRVSKAPVGIDQELEVILINYSSAYSYQVPGGNWTARGATLPSKGDGCVVVFDDDGDAWMPVWEGVTAFPSAEGVNTIWTTAGAPGAGLGQDGDYAIDPLAWVIYGPKAGGAWPAGTNIKGPKGDQGDRGLQGLTGDEGPSAYEVWLAAGNTGTVADYLVSIKGAKGDKGDTGYETAPIGATIGWSRKTLPSGWVVADGASYTESAYPEACAVAATEVAAGNTLWTVTGAAPNRTFTVPNMTDTFIYSRSVANMGARGGASSITIGAGNLPPHVHTEADHNHFPYNGYTNGFIEEGGTAQVILGSGSALAVRYTNPSTGGKTAQTNTGNGPGASTPIASLPPYVAVAQIVKLKGVAVSGATLVGPTGPPGADATSLYTLPPARCATTGNVNLASPGATFDGVSPAVGEYVLAWLQTTGSQNGLYVFQGASTAMTRASEAPTGASLRGGLRVSVVDGTLWGQRDFLLKGTGTVGTSSLAFSPPRGSSISFTRMNGLGAGAAMTGLTSANNYNIISSGGQLAQVVYTPPVNVEWECSIKYRMSKVDAAYNYSQCGLRLTPTDRDGIGGPSGLHQFALRTQHSAVQTYEPYEVRKTFRLVAGTAYTLDGIFMCSAGTWDVTCTQNEFGMEARAFVST